MAQVVRTFDTPILLNGVPYHAQVCARPNGHLWEGWIEFAADDGSDIRRTGRETTQPNRDAIVYWSQGLSGTYLEGALARALTQLTVTVRDVPKPHFDSPAPAVVVAGAAGQPPTEVNRAVLDPFSVATKGEHLLRQELGALRDWHLRNIIRAYDLADPALDLEQLTAPQLVEIIVAAVQPA